MAIPSREQLDHDAAIDYLKQGCQRVNAIDIDDNDVLPCLSPLYYRAQTQLHDLARFAAEISGRYRSISERKLIAGFSYGVFTINLCNIPKRDFRIKTESITTPDVSIDDRIFAFKELAYDDSIYEIREEFPWPDNPDLYGKDYELGLRSLLAAGYLVTKDMTENMNAEEAKLWFDDTDLFLKNKRSKIIIPEHYKDWYIS
jgi:hypothetical protein